MASRWGQQRAYSAGDEVVLMRGSVCGTVIRRVQDNRAGVPRYSVRTDAGTRIVNVNGMRAEVRSNG